MSGAEVVGLVLGAIPLLISGLEHYGEGVRTIQKVANSSREFRKLKLALECEQEIFLNTIEKLLKDDVEDQLLATITRANAADRWSDLKVDQCLQRRLGRSYGPYVASGKAMGVAIQEFQESLQLGADGKGPFSETNWKSVRSALKSIKFGLRMRKYEEMMNEIRISNQRLCQLAADSSPLEPIRGSRRRTPDYEKARAHACDIFRNLQRALVTSCNAKHKASFYMRPVEISCAGRIARATEERFRVVLHHEVLASNQDQTQPPWLIEEAEIRLLEDENPQDGAETANFRAVRFSPPNPNPQVKQPSQDFKEINDLCGKLKSLRGLQTSRNVCFGYLSNFANDCRHGLFWPDRPLVDQASPSTLSLADILDKQQGHRLAEFDKRQLALALALGMLRLYDTPWLASQWGRKEVLLFKRRGGIVAGHPFISAEVPNVVTTALMSSSTSLYFTPCRLIKEETLFALGLLLIELAMEQSFEELKRPEDLNSDGSKHHLSDYCTADRLVDEIYAVAGERYGDVVRRCIKCEFDEHESALSSAAFRRKVYDGVIAELEQDLQDIQSI